MIFFGVAGIFFVMALAVGVLYLYQDKIIGLFVAEANQHIKTKVAVEKIEVTWWEQFPQVAIRMENVEITETVPGSKVPLARMKKVYSTFDIWDLLRGTYHLREMHLEDGTVHARVLPNGEANYLFYQSTDTVQGDKLSFELQRISLRRVQVIYQDLKRKQRFQAQAHAVSASLSMEEPILKIEASGNTRIHAISIGSNDYFRDKEVTLHSHLSLNTQKKEISIEPSEVKIGRAVYEVNGQIAHRGKTQLDLQVKGKNTDVQSILALLPPKFSRQFSKYRSSGNVYFSGGVKGEMSSRKNPQVTLSFGARNASFFHPDYREKIEQVNLEGRFTNGAQQSWQTSVLELRKIQGKLQGNPFSGEVVYRNFANPDLQVQLKAQVDVGHVLGLFPVKDIKSGSGQAQVQFAFSGNVGAFRRNPNGAGISASGEATLKQVRLQLRQHPVPLTNLTGSFLFRKNDVAVSGLKGRMGNSDFQANGTLHNVLAWLFLKNQTLRVGAEVKVGSLDLNQVLTASSGAKSLSGLGKGKVASSYAFNMPARLELDLKTSAQKVKFRRFRGRQLHGRIQLKDKVLSTPGMAVQAGGGTFSIRGRMDARRPLIKVTSVANLENIRVDSLFYVFEDFGQNFIMQRHLRGELTAQIESDTYLDHHLSPRTDLVQAQVKTILRNGQLIQFAPMQKLSLFVKRDELANLRFSEIRNNFYIRNRIVYIPEMEIKSSATRLSSMSVSGTHTFDQVMDYHVRLPLKANRRDKDERFGVVAAGPTYNPNLFLTIKGREGNFKVAYDQQRVKQKVATDLKREKKVLKEILQGKHPEKKETKTVKPSTEYFEF
ncbi:hypothetical protein EFB08_10025 [Rufibacter latericius]|uniref:Uncharacterized protein n=1 Tax=Rufibacter latericius TaxID=2487040 RepID=A0A3M9MNP4_9BACT|nr:hypothetical protein EFB08_10025 [Rufibacter latericius]